jgi:hypothetical protein
MVFGLKSRHPPKDSLDIGLSSWVDVGGAVQNRQVVPSQIALVTKALVLLYENAGVLPSLYIISGIM